MREHSDMLLHLQMGDEEPSPCQTNIAEPLDTAA